MINSIKTFVCLLLCMAIAACTSLHQIPTPSIEAASPENPSQVSGVSAKSSKQIQVGDRLHLVLHDGTNVRLRVTGTEPGVILGWDVKSWKEQRIELRTIAKIERRQFSALKTAGAVGAGVLVIWGFGLWAVHRAWRH